MMNKMITLATAINLYENHNVTFEINDGKVEKVNLPEELMNGGKKQ